MLAIYSNCGDGTFIASVDSFSIDQIDPVIISGPENISDSTSASFSFTTGRGGAKVERTECRLDQGAFQDCQSPINYNDLSEGEHTFSVRAWDRNGNSSTSKSYYWLVYTSPFAVTLDISTHKTQASLMGWKMTNGNGSFPYADFNEKGMVDTVNEMFPLARIGEMSEFSGGVPSHRPKDWFKSENPFFSHIRIGNFIFGHCNSAPWTERLGLNLEEFVNTDSNGNPYFDSEGRLTGFNFKMINLYVANMLASGVKPHVVFSGVPKAIAGSMVQCREFGCVSAPPSEKEVQSCVKCCKFGRVSSAPPSDMMDHLESMYDKLIENFKEIFSEKEVQSWEWSAWSEFNCECSFVGTVGEAVEIVRRNVRVAKKHGLSYRLGDFTGLIPGTYKHEKKGTFLS